MGCHESGAVHNNIIVDNVIVKENKNDARFLVKLIDLDLASVIRMHE